MSLQSLQQGRWRFDHVIQNSYHISTVCTIEHETDTSFSSTSVYLRRILDAMKIIFWQHMSCDDHWQRIERSFSAISLEGTEDKSMPRGAITEDSTKAKMRMRPLKKPQPLKDHACNVLNDRWGTEEVIIRNVSIENLQQQAQRLSGRGEKKLIKGLPGVNSQHYLHQVKALCEWR